MKTPERLSGDAGGYLWVVAGYWVDDRRVLLIKKRDTGLWVPPGGHVEHGETFEQALRRELYEETGVDVFVLSSGPEILLDDQDSSPEPVPFYVDRETLGFEKAAIVQFFFVRPKKADSVRIAPLDEEVEEYGWFDERKIAAVATYAQVRSLATFAISHYPAIQREE
jgi:8-oxo-dGTP pyrophosphatase MutT (NUDIX family)